MSSPLKIGLMGYGFAGATFHAPVIAHCGRAQVAAIATGQPDKARADFPQATIVPDLDALLALADVECVVIATPNDTHFELAKRTLEAGKHVVVDKPVTLSAADARTLASLAQSRKRVFAPFHNRRWDGDFLTVRALLESGELGRVTHFESHFDRFRPEIRQRWREDATRGGGLLFDLGPHLIDQALALFGVPETVYATVKAHRDHASAPDYVHLQLGYAAHEVVLHASALTALAAPRFTIHGTRGSYLKYGLDTQEDQLKAGLRPGDAGFGGGNEAGTLRVLDGEQEVERTSPTRDGAYADFYRALAASIQDGAPFPVSAQDAVDVMTVIELAQRSDNEGVRLPFRRGD
ncbi:oxidoreductase [Paraburkholderia humisilvae]|uniref:Putative oxidoreductase YdgJ n=1 Tax=Paraburkholderia humisilvae TaxID=627669 RepID=A0A6J5EEW3_9BURK|nr:oxidoreductase [Paraburkholderia humisilvae]CAB3765108.1 putative oxidoreductase YdgJ [Paraburkholderia humisilvae]